MVIRFIRCLGSRALPVSRPRDSRAIRCNSGSRGPDCRLSRSTYASPSLNLPSLAKTDRRIRSISPGARHPPVWVAGDEQVSLDVLGHGAARVMSPAFSPRIVDGVAYLLIDLGTDAKLYDRPRSGLMRLYGSDVPFDVRKMVAYVRQI